MRDRFDAHVAEPVLTRDGPTGGNGGEITPTLVERQDGKVGGIGTEGSLDVVLVVVVVGETAEVGKLGIVAFLTAGDRLGSGTGLVGEVSVVRVELRDTQVVKSGTGDLRVDRVVGAPGVGHTSHRIDIVLLGEGLVVVHEVFPLVVGVRSGGSGDRHIVGDGIGIGHVRPGHRVADRAVDGITQTGSEGDVLDRGEVEGGRTAEVEALVHRVGVVDVDVRVDVVRLLERGHRIVVAVLILDEVMALCHQCGHVGRQVVGRIDDRGERVHLDDGCREGIHATGADRLRRAVTEAVVRGELEPLLDLVVGIDGRTQTAEHILLADHRTVVVEIRDGGIEGTVVVGAHEREVVTLHQTLLESDLGPVGIGVSVVVLVDDALRDQVAFAYPGQVVFRIEGLRNVHHVVERDLRVVTDDAAAFDGLLGGDQHHTVTGLRTVDGGGSGVLEDLHALDVVRIELRDVAHAQTVDHIKRVGGGVGTVTADTHRGFGTRRTGEGDELDTGGLALEGALDIRNGTVLDVCGLDLGDGAGHVALALHTVTDDHRLRQHVRLRFHGQVDHGLVGGDDLRRVADEGEFEIRARGDGQGVLTIDIRGDTVGSALLHHGNANHGEILLVHDGTGDRYRVLGEGQTCAQEHHQDERKDSFHEVLF